MWINTSQQPYNFPIVACTFVMTLLTISHQRKFEQMTDKLLIKIICWILASIPLGLIDIGFWFQLMGYSSQQKETGIKVTNNFLGQICLETFIIKVTTTVNQLTPNLMLMVPQLKKIQNILPICLYLFILEHIENPFQTMQDSNLVLKKDKISLCKISR